MPRMKFLNENKRVVLFATQFADTYKMKWVFIYIYPYILASTEYGNSGCHNWQVTMSCLSPLACWDKQAYISESTVAGKTAVSSNTLIKTI